jgi:hypothetical protein
VNREIRLRRPGVRQAFTGLVCLLVPGLTPESTAARSRQREWREPVASPYLVATGPPGLRFQALVAPTEPARRPVAIGPPVPGLTAEETVVAAANTAALQSAPTAGPAPPATGVATPDGLVPRGTPAPAKPLPAPLLRDDARPQIRAEDFIPFFQVPGKRPAAPTTALPASSATYTQSP